MASDPGDTLCPTFLTDGGQPATEVAGLLAGFLRDAQRTIDIAIYDSSLTGAAANIVAGAVKDCKDRGVKIRAAYYAGHHSLPGTPPPRGQSDSFLGSLDVDTRPISSEHALMHDKYVVRDVGTENAAVWTGSANWTLDTWTRQENLLLRIFSSPVTNFYSRDFQDLWTSGDVDDTGANDGGAAGVQFDGQNVSLGVWFSPGQGQEMAHAVADAIRDAREAVTFASPVLTSGSILGALRDAADSGIPVRGAYDWTQMQEVFAQWNEDARASWKPGAFHDVQDRGHLAGKHSTPYSPDGLHDFMHAKILVADDIVFTGSYNFSNSGEENAENLIRVQSAAFASMCREYIDSLIARYGSFKNG